MRLVALVCVAACGRIGFDESRGGDQGDDAAAGDDADVNINAGLIGWWQFDDGSGTTTTDSSGFGNAGTFSAGVSWTAGRIAGAIAVDGAFERYVNLGDPNAFHFTSSMTLAAWANPSAYHTNDTSDEVMISRDDAGRAELGWALKTTEDCGSETFSIQIGTGGSGSVHRCSTAAPALGVWSHVVGVYDAAEPGLHIYIDGVLDDGTLSGAVPPMQAVPNTLAHTQIGNANPNNPDVGGYNSYFGLIDDVRIYDRVLNDAEIRALATP